MINNQGEADNKKSIMNTEEEDDTVKMMYGKGIIASQLYRQFPWQLS